jgi:hypothetical protein
MLTVTAGVISLPAMALVAVAFGRAACWGAVSTSLHSSMLVPSKCSRAAICRRLCGLSKAAALCDWRHRIHKTSVRE